MSKDVVLTGLRANSEFHIGNYLGGILPVVALQNRHAGDYQVNMFVPDLHSFTTPIDHTKLYQQIIDNLKVFVAAGLDINHPDTYLYRQSFVPAHSELTWILDCFANMGELSRMTQFGEKGGVSISKADAINISQELAQALKNDSGPTVEYTLLVSKIKNTIYSYSHKGIEAGVGLFNYPVLMAADILLYDAKYVPVGDDQKQHLELTRDLAIRMNNKFDEELFTVPEAWNKQLEFMNLAAGARIRSLRNPDKKMSKSVSDPSGTITLSDNPAEAAKKIMRAETDSFGEIRYDFAERPGISNLLQMLALLTERSQDDVNTEWEGQSRYGDLKKAVAEAVSLFLENIQAKISQVNEAELIAKLEQDEKAMNEVANAKLLAVQKAVGLRK